MNELEEFYLDQAYQVNNFFSFLYFLFYLIKI